VDRAEQEPERCFRDNVEGPALLAAACARRDIGLLTFSSDLVFDGRVRRPYIEKDSALPLNVYGRSKAEAECRVLDIFPEALVVRTSAFFGPWDTHNFVIYALRTLAAGQPFRAAEDATISPTYVPDLVHACLDLLIDQEWGLWHLSSGEAISWAGLAQRAAERAALDPGGVEACALDALQLPAPRPLYSVLGSERGSFLPPLENALGRYFAQAEIPWADAPCKVSA
jgi:dTDP-4-dehydrorhamnose reductase